MNVRDRDGAVIAHFSDATWAELTVAELFALSGFPVPEGARLCIRYDHTGVGIYAVADHCVWRAFDDGWHSRSGLLFPPYDLSRLPAADAWECLPDVVKAIVSPAKEGE